MKQSLGLTYSSTEPVSAIISMRLVQVQQTYGGTALLAGITRMKRQGKPSRFDKTDIQYWTDLHLFNLVQTYGQSKVNEVYNMIYSLNNNVDKQEKIG